MQKLVDTSPNDEINLYQLFVTLWAYKIFIAFTCALGITYSGYYVMNTDKEFTTEAVFRLDQQDTNSLSLSGEIGVLANLAGYASKSSTGLLPLEQITGRIFIERLDKILNFQADNYFNTYNPNSLDTGWKSYIKRTIGWQNPGINTQEAMWQNIITKKEIQIV